MLVHEIGRLALGTAQIGAQGILCTILSVFDLAGHLIAIQIQFQLFERRNGNTLRLVRYKRKGTCIDLISPGFLQPQDRHAVIVSILML